MNEYYPEDRETFDVETENPGCHVINNLLTEFARAVLGNIDPQGRGSMVQYGQYTPVRLVKKSLNTMPISLEIFLLTLSACFFQFE